MKKIVFTAVACLLALVSKADPSKASFVSDKCTLMQVFIDGKRINDEPKTAIQVKTTPGLHKVYIRVFDQFGCEEATLLDDIIFEPGFKSKFKLIVDFYEACTELEITGMEPIYSNRYRRPDRFYNKKLYA